MGNLSDSIKTPIVHIYNATGAKIIDSMEDKPIGLVNFRYKYDDEEDDRCYIKIESIDAHWLELLDIQRNDRLRVSWGYIGGPMTGQIPVVVRDIKSKYGPDVIWTEFECTDLATYLKLTKSADTEEITLRKYLQKYCTAKVKIVVKESGKVIYKQSIRKDPDNKYEVISIPNGQGYKDVYNETTDDSEEALEEKVYDAGTWFCKNDNQVKQFFETDRSINGVNRSPHIVIYDGLRNCPNGPWFITGRGDTLLIHNRNLGNKIFRSYAYKQEPGYLMDFEASTKYENFEKRTISQNNMDPLTKTGHFIDTYLNRLESMRDIKTILEDKKISKSAKEEEIKAWVTVYQNGYQRYKAGATAYEETADGNIYAVKDWTNYDNSGYDKQARKYSTRVAFPADLVDYSETIFNPVKVIRRGFVFTAPYDSWDDVKNDMENTARELEMEKEEAKIIIEGDPDIMNDMIINVSNVQAVHTGNYYIKNSEHEISSSGYRVSMDTLKVVEEAILNTQSEEGEQVKETDGLKFNAKERYKREEGVFRKWNIDITIAISQFKSPQAMVLGSYSNQGYDLEQVEWISFKELLNTKGPDEAISKLINVWEKDSTRVQFKENVDITNVEER